MAAAMRQFAWLGVIRHGQSTGNVAAERAERTGAETIAIPERDADVPLSGTGREQALAVGSYLRELPAAELPGVAVVSPCRRARQTAELALSDLAVPVTVDERLRDRELGVLDLLTNAGVAAPLPRGGGRRAGPRTVFSR